VAIGDVTSDKKGTGARYNDGKVPYELIAWKPFALALCFGSPTQSEVRYVLMMLGEFQAGGAHRQLHMALQHTASAAGLTMMELYAETARVLEYGKAKYAEWNWAKGQSWQAVIACVARHLLGTPDQPGMWDEPGGLDRESGLLHAGHVACNLMFLMQFMITFPEGDDRPKALVEKPF